MATVPLTPELVTVDGLDPTENAVSTGNDYTIANNARMLVLYQSTSGTNMVFVTTVTVQGLAVDDRVVVHGIGDETLVGVFSPTVYGSTLTMQVSASGTAAVLQLPT